MKSLHFTSFLLCIVILMSCGRPQQGSRSPRAEKGVLDLRGWQFEKHGTVNLDGQWHFYWQKLLAPDDFETGSTPKSSGFLNIPGRWNGFEADGEKIPGTGFATFRLHIKVNPSEELYALKILDMATSYRIWANQELVLSNGRVGKNKAESSPQFFPKVASISQKSGSIYLTLQVSNFSHRKGGVWEPIQFGLENQVRRKNIQNLGFELFLMGSLLVMALYHLGLFVLRRSDLSTIYFSAVCFLVTIRTLTVGERFLIFLFPRFNWEVFQKIEYISLYLSLPMFYLFLSYLFTEFSKLIGKAITVIGVILSLFTLFSPAIVFSHAIIYYQIIMIALCVYGPVALIIAMFNKRKGAGWVFSGLVFLAATVVYEILAQNELVYAINLTPLGLFVFIFVQSVLLSIRFSQAFNLAEDLSEKLEIKVEQRTLGLTKANEEIREASEKLKETQFQLIQSQKMEAMGTLAGGIAHEFNNILSTILGYAELLKNELKGDGFQKEAVNAIFESGNRAAGLVRQILTFSRIDNQDLTPMKIQPSLKETLNMIQTTLSESVKLKINIQPDCGPILANRNQISQTVVNLCANARDAMKSGGGVIELELKEISIHKNEFPENPEAEGLYLQLSVKDIGIGMSDGTKKRIFDPFYTTKGVNEGTGLGLSIVHGIVQNHSGFIKVDSYPEKGTRIDVFIPVTSEELTNIPETDTNPKKGKGHILIVEDDIKLSAFYNTVLKRLGYETTVYLGGQEALDHFKASPEQFHLVFSDQNMPNMTGFDMSLEMLKVRPEIPIILITGYSSTVSQDEVKKAGIKYFLTKPIRITDLAHKLSELI